MSMMTMMMAVVYGDCDIDDDIDDMVSLGRTNRYTSRQKTSSW